MTDILQGVRVLELSVWQHGPYAGVMLADMGADVIHIEGPDSPDPGRSFANLPKNGLNHYFHAHNRGKRAVSLNLKTENGRNAFYRLIENADVFISNLRLKALERIGADYATLAKLNPQLIYAHGSGNGPYGPDADQPSMDLNGQARGGIMWADSDSEGVPRASAAGVADHVGAIMLAFGIMSALYHRERTGEGQQLFSSLLGSQLCIQAYQITGVLFNDNAPMPRRLGSRTAGNPTWNVYKGSDDRWFVISMINDSFWHRFCTVLDRPEWLTDERYMNLRVRGQNAAALVAELDEMFATRPAGEWVKLFNAADLIAAPVNSYSDLHLDAQTTLNGYITAVEGPDGQPPVNLVGSPVIFSKTPAHPRGLAPEFDQHTEECLLEVGITWEEMEQMRQQGDIGTRATTTT
jgi:crotonobetainyl-CoA:carnitine CoA-transferase CaiB-like acyl-CoA transferase